MSPASRPYVPTITRAGRSRQFAVIVTKDSGKQVEFGAYDDELEAQRTAGFLNSLGCRAAVTRRPPA